MFFRHNTIALNRLQGSVNVTLLHTGKLKHLHDGLYCSLCSIVVWNQTGNACPEVRGRLETLRLGLLSSDPGVSTSPSPACRYPGPEVIWPLLMLIKASRECAPFY